MSEAESQASEDGRSEAAAPAPPEAAAACGADAALERERSLPRQIDGDRQLLVWLGRGVLRILSPEPALLRFWRWLIDDLRSERRQQAALLGEPVSERLLADWGVRFPMQLNPIPWIVRSWHSLRRRGRRRR